MNMINVKKIEDNQNISVVYDLSLDGTVVNALGMNVMSNTDGFNFKKPKVFRYTEENPYISKGLGRNYKKGNKYTGVDADVAEFEDLYLNQAYNGGILKTGLGIDEYCDACIQFSRKNYADLMPDGNIKLVGNTIKSKKMPKYIEKFLDKGIRLLLEGKGKEFLEYYYDYVEKIYNMQIALRDIASVGKIKTSIREYKESCKQLTAGGTKKARQAWYELAIKHGMNPDMGTSIYYINTGKKKSSSDVQRITRYYEYRDGVKTEITKELEKEYKLMQKDEAESYDFRMSQMSKPQWWKTKHPDMIEEDELVFNCVLLPDNIVEDDDEHYCDDSFEYNVEKYIDMFNKRIRPLLVVFDNDIRSFVNEKGKVVDNILINKPQDRKSFTEEEAQLVGGQPFNETDQDTYEQLMTMEDKEIRFWLSVNKEPPYVNDIDGMNWEEIKADYIRRQEAIKKEGVRQEITMYDSIIGNLKQSDITDLVENGKLPDKLLSLVDENYNTGTFFSKKWGVKLGTIYDILDKSFAKEVNDDE